MKEQIEAGNGGIFENTKERWDGQK
jgi:hypothetical protein